MQENCVLFWINPASNATKQLLYVNLPLIFQTIQVRQIWLAEHCLRTKMDSCIWTHYIDLPAKSYIHQFYVDSWWLRMAKKRDRDRENLGNQYQQDLMMMMITYISLSLVCVKKIKSWYSLIGNFWQSAELFDCKHSLYSADS